MRIGAYEVTGELGRGATATVHEARGPDGARVAVKLITAGSRLASDRFQREVEALRRLRHPGIVSFVDAGEHQGRPFLVTELVDGETLQARLDRVGSLAPRAAIDLGAALADALAHAHAEGVLHRDLKPANVLLGVDGRPRLADFGLARDLEASLSSLTASGALLGSPGYWAPEQAQGASGPAEPATDVWGLGATLYAALTREPPFSGGSLAEVCVATVQQPVVAPSALEPSVPRDLEAVVLRCLEKAPGTRYPSASAVGDALRACQRPGRRGERRGRWPLAAALGAVAVGAGPALLLARREAPVHDLAAPAPAPPSEAPGARLAAASRALDAAAAALEQAERAVPSELRSVVESIDAVAREPALADRAAALGRRARAELGLALARELSRRRAPTSEVLAALSGAVEAAGPEPALAARVRLARADLLRRRGRHAAAVAEAEPLAAAAGEVGLRARAIAAISQLDSEEYARARAGLDSLARDDPRGAPGLVAGSFLASLEGRRAEAAALAHRARIADPTYALAHLRRAQALVILDREPEAAREALDAALELAPDDVRALLTRHDLDLAAGRDRERCLADLDLAAELGAPEVDPSVLYERGKELLLLRRLPQALADLDELARREPAHVGTRLLRGLIHEAMAAGSPLATEDWREGRRLDERAFDDATERLTERAMRRRIREAVGLADVGSPAFRLGQLAPAAEQLLEARAGRASAPAREPLLEALRRGARGEPWRNLELLYDRAERAAPGDPVVSLERVRVTVGRDALAPATAAIERARAAGAAPLEVDRLAGELALRRDRRSLADEALRDLARRDPDGVEGRCALAEAERLRGRLEPALAAADAALAVDGEHAGALTVRALVLLELGQSRRAYQLLDQHLVRHGAIDARPLLGRYVAMCRTILDEARRRGGEIERQDLLLISGELQGHQRMSEGAAGSIASAGLLLAVKGEGTVDFGRQLLAAARQREPERPDLLLVLGRYAVESRDADLARSMWRRAREVEPLFVVTAEARAEYTAAFGPSPEVDALAAPP